MRKLVQLFAEFFKISLCVIGGGYAIVAVAEEIFSRKGWTKEGELIDQLPVFQMIPGLIATHTAVYVGNRMAGTMGAALGVVAVAIPSIAIFTIVSVLYHSLPLNNAWVGAALAGFRASLTGIIAATVVRTWLRSERTWFFYTLFILGVIAVGGLDIAVPLVIVAAIGMGLTKEFAAGGGRFNASILPLLLFLKYGALGFGGGFVLVPMYMQDFVGASAPFLQLSGEEFSTIMSLTQITPGPIGVNCATYFGYRIAGIGGAVSASACLLLPGSLLALIAFKSLERFKGSRVVRGMMTGIRPASLAMMTIALMAFGKASLTGWGSAMLIVACGAATYTRKVNVVLAILMSGLLGLGFRALEIPI